MALGSSGRADAVTVTGRVSSAFWSSSSSAAMSIKYSTRWLSWAVTSCIRCPSSPASRSASR